MLIAVTSRACHPEQGGQSKYDYFQSRSCSHSTTRYEWKCEQSSMKCLMVSGMLMQNKAIQIWGTAQAVGEVSVTVLCGRGRGA